MYATARLVGKGDAVGAVGPRQWTDPTSISNGSSYLVSLAPGRMEDALNNALCELRLIQYVCLNCSQRFGRASNP